MARQMKDSGIEWIGEIPETWGLYRAKYLFQTGDGALRIGPFGSALSGKALAEGPYKIYNQAHLVSNDFSLSRHFISEETYQELQSYEVAPGDILFSMMGTIGKCRVMPTGQQSGIMDSHLLKARLNDLVIPRYFEYVYDKDLSPIGIGQLAFYSNGSIMAGLNSSIVKNVFFPLPSVAEQQRIADFLDRKCAEIDAVIERTKATIEEYKKLKQAVITEAVTKGVRGPRPMKDSGIEWVAEIVDSWKMSRIGLHYSIVLGKMLCDKQLTDEYTLEPYFCAANIHFDGVSQEQLKQMWFSPAEKASYCVQNGDLLVVEGGAGAGGAAIVKTLEQSTYVQNSVMIVRGLAGQSNRYLRYWIECLVKKGYVDVVCNKATIPHFTKDKLATMPVLVIPVAEMEEIADYLDDKCAALDTLIAKKTALLTELETYKKSLIYEYVTGKKEVQ